MVTFKKSHDKFKEFLRNSGIEHQRVAELLNRDKSVISRKINGKSGNFDLEEIRIICERWDLDPNEYFIHAKVSKKETAGV